MSRVVGANVARSARMADMFQQADQDARQTLRMSATAKWHETQSIKTLSRANHGSRERQSILEEQEGAAHELLVRRKQKMKELYESEYERFSKELKEQGLVLSEK
ncbi:hypothetical protein GUITHDRAFT_149909 [Guillardia theta CCMP2712]|uniref:Uncharacterized protein n=2 Tax=Guillardia theta TaxID=55529 RepID=L1K398_GUITC|nr:hypothetical protein GUITHDRAFT_149909 [Guillardia theta CCMP2712]EKX54935.1 hypothetical protein GUITHDRAFT_149909 [Guillardia theta CCMP2712]|eukprot:XP_005841915.1 hypothetical protein GUITHDRAFT_149909 [Guillardia theta CCMP2712]